MGLDFHLDKARTGNTFDAHRLIHYAHESGKQDALKERLMAGYFVEGEAIGEREVLVRLAIDVGLDGPAVRDVLESGAFSAKSVTTRPRRERSASRASRSLSSTARTGSPARSRPS